MRTITKNIYFFNELPTDNAKETARNWWRELESQDPAWNGEHADSCQAARAYVRKYHDVGSLLEAITALRSDPKCSCPWTGHAGDEQAIDIIIDACAHHDTIAGILEAIDAGMSKAWDDEMEDRLNNTAEIDDTLTINQYEFYEDGTIV